MILNLSVKVWHSSFRWLTFSEWKHKLLQQVFGHRKCVPHNFYSLDHKSSVNHENSFAWAVMKKNDSYTTSIVDECRLLNEYQNYWENKQVRPRLKEFISTKLSVVENQEIESLELEKYSNVVEEIKNATVLELQCVLIMLSKWKLPSTPKTEKFHGIWKEVDLKACAVMKDLPLNDVLLLADCLFLMKLNRICKYNEQMLNYLFHDKLNFLSSSEFVQLMFYANLQRSLSTTLAIKAEKKALRVFNSLTIDEIGVVALGFFKTQNGIRSSTLMEKLVNKAINSFDRIENLTFAAITKCLKKSSTVQEINSQLQKFLICSESHVTKLSPVSCVHLCLLGTNAQIYNKSVVQKSLVICSEHVRSLRIKDISQMMFLAALFNHNDPNYMESTRSEIIKRLNSKEIKKYPRSLLRYALALCYFDIFEDEILNHIFSEEFYEMLSKSNENFSRDLLVLHNSVQIEYENYDGKRLPNVIVKGMRKYIENEPSLPAENSLHAKLKKKVYSTLVEVIGHSNNVISPNILPHFAFSDILVPFRKNVASVKQVSAPYDLQCQRPGKWTCFLIGSKNSYLFRSGTPVAVFRKKKVQLKKLGYRVIEIPWFEFQNLSPDRARTYLLNKLE